jgi:hypothetical protein
VEVREVQWRYNIGTMEVQWRYNGAMEVQKRCNGCKALNKGLHKQQVRRYLIW